MQARYDRATAGVQALGELLKRSAPDVLVVVGDDQYEQFQYDNMPMFCVFRGETLPTAKRSRDARARTGSRAWDSTLWDQIQAQRQVQEDLPPEQPSVPELGEHLVRSFVDDEFDVASSTQMKPEVGLGHAFTFVYNRLAPPDTVPMLPVMVNTFFPPNNPAPKRAYAFGQALRRGIESWTSEKRVAILASGGLSHTAVDEEMDGMLLDGIVERNREQLCSMPRERLRNGTSELLNWIILAGAMEDRGFRFLMDYVPSYRTEAGTGNGLAIGYWE